MTFDDYQKYIFFEVLNKISNNSSEWMTKDDIVREAGKQIPIRTARVIFDEFSEGGIKYLDDQSFERFKISDSGKVYWNFLKLESDKLRLEKESIQSVIDTNRSTKFLNDAVLPANFDNQDRNAVWSLRLAGLSVLFIALTFYQQCRDKTEQRLQDLSKQVQESKKSLDTIRLSLKEINFSIRQKKNPDTLLVRPVQRKK